MDLTGAIAVEKWLDARRPDSAGHGRLATGAKLGEWRIVAFLGRGLSAEVYRVTNLRFGQEGALKLLTDGTRGLKERFLTEADAIRFLSIRALPHFMGSGEYNGMPFYVMEYLQPLPDPMPRREIPAFMNKVAKAVQMLHDAGYIHRDLKPGNILRRHNGEPVLIDLGLIKKRSMGTTDPVVRHGRGISFIDGKPVGVGTLDYAAPEQLLKGEATVQSDVFAMGKILRWLYDGRPPGNIKKIIRRATREQPGDRYASADDFASALRHRNYARIAFAFFACIVLACVALFPMAKPRMAKALLALLEPPRKPFVVKPQPDETEAAYLSRIVPLARDGNTQAQIAVAEAHFFGRGTPTNRAAAVEWYRIAAEAGEPDAQASLGACLHNGWGCEKDLEEAARWSRQAAENGNLRGMSDLAYYCLHGFGIEKDEEKGFQWAMKAAERGHAPAQAMVGECYLDGRGVERSEERGETWLYRAVRQGSKRAKMLLETR